VVVFSLVLVVKEHRPTSVHSDVERFSEGLRALAPRRGRHPLRRPRR
jgi:hypothetical protein